ncbi:MAG: hypothetical protein JSV33_11000 [bacterium]|nr:MAG: hypothetical protein JSV33_11000 [bacterium]
MAAWRSGDLRESMVRESGSVVDCALHINRHKTVGGLIAALVVCMVQESAPLYGYTLTRHVSVQERSGGLSVPGDTAAYGADTTRWTLDGLKDLLAAESGAESIRGKIWRQRKSGRIAMLCSLIFPGLGQMYNERPLKAALALGAQTFYLSQVWLNRRYADRAERKRDSYPRDSFQWRQQDFWVYEYKERAIDWIWWSAGAILVITLDAYVDAHIHDMRFRVGGDVRADGAGVALTIDF